MTTPAPTQCVWRCSIALAVFAFAGCGEPYARVELYQPKEDGPQRRIALDSTRAYLAPAGEDAAARLLCEWPLPGSRHGRTQFALYLVLGPEPCRQQLGDPLGDERMVSGFLLQRSGRLAGLAPVVEGSIDLQSLDPPEGELDLTCLDGTIVTGSFRAQVRPRPVRLLEEDRAADVAESVRLLRVHRGEIEPEEPTEQAEP